MNQLLAVKTKRNMLVYRMIYSSRNYVVFYDVSNINYNLFQRFAIEHGKRYLETVNLMNNTLK